MIVVFSPPGQLETNIFEDTLRETFGVNSYVAFTMDKLIQNVVRQVFVVRHLEEYLPCFYVLRTQRAILFSQIIFSNNLVQFVSLLHKVK